MKDLPNVAGGPAITRAMQKHIQGVRREIDWATLNKPRPIPFTPCPRCGIALPARPVENCPNCGRALGNL